MRRPRPQGAALLPPAWQEYHRLLWWAAGGGGLLVWVITRWPVHGLLTAALIAGAPYVLHPGGSAVRRIEMIEALGEWLHHLASVHVAGLALEQTIRASGPSAPDALREPIQLLVSRLNAHWTPADAYRAFGDDLADGVADDVVLMLITHTDHRGAGMSTALRELADGLEYEATHAREIEAERARIRTSARWISVVAIGLMVLTLFAFDYAEPFSTAQGQLALAVAGGLFILMFVWMHQVSRARPADRLLESADAPEQARGVAS